MPKGRFDKEKIAAAIKLTSNQLLHGRSFSCRNSLG